MYDLINSDDRRVKYALGTLAWVLLAGSLVYNIYLVWATPNPGFTYDTRWTIVTFESCDGGPDVCPDPALLNRGDRLMRVGGVTFQDYMNQRTLVPFQGFQPGEVVPLVVFRDGQTLEIDWRMQAVEAATIIRVTVISLLVYGSFWIAGTYILLYMRPADITWILLVGLYYLTTVWLAVGLVAQSNVASTAEIVRVVGWFLAAVLVHLHLVVPGSRLRPQLRSPVAVMYGATLLLVILQMAGLLPWLAYLGGILIASLISISLLVYRVVTPRAPSEKLTAQLMLAGIVLALVPGLVLSAIPLLLAGSSGVLGAALSILTLPLLPLFYTYAIYKHRLGNRERRINRLLVQYALFLMYFFLLALVFVIMSNWIWTANALLSIVILGVLALVVALLPIRRPVQTVFDRFTYGTRYSHREILAQFTEQIPAAVDRQDLVHLLKYDLTAEMEIRQSALYIRHDALVAPLYCQGVGVESCPSTWQEMISFLGNLDQYPAGSDSVSHNPAGRLDWVRLVIPLRVKCKPTGVWLFGRRESDDLFSQDDIDLLERLSGLVAVTLESSQLLEALTEELDTRKKAEARLEDQSKRLRALHDIDRAILAADTPANIARAAFKGLRQLVPHIRASVFLLDAEGDKMTILAAQGSGTDAVAENDSIPRQAMRAIELLSTGQVFVNQDLQAADNDSALVNSLTPAGVRAVISAPLMSSGAMFGALNVANDIPGFYTPAHVEIVEEVATSVAMAIHNARLREEVNANSRELKLLSTRLINAQETERKRLSHELHDEIGQILTAISLNLAAIDRNLPKDGGVSLEEQLTDANKLVMNLTNQVRSLSLELRPSMLHDLGLISTLRWYVSNHARRSEAKINFEANNLPDRLPEDVEIAAYRVVQEALTNVSRHSGATQVDLSVEGINGQVHLVIEDNGRGFNPEEANNGDSTALGIGLVTMRERVGALNGHLEVRSEAGKGTRIMAELPLEDGK